MHLNIPKKNGAQSTQLSIGSGTFLMEAAQSVTTLEIEAPDLRISELQKLLTDWEWTEKSRDIQMRVSSNAALAIGENIAQQLSS